MKTSNPRLPAIGKPISRDLLQQLIAAGWTQRRATINEAWPSSRPHNRMVRVVVLGQGDAEPRVFIPPAPPALSASELQQEIDYIDANMF